MYEIQILRTKEKGENKIKKKIHFLYHFGYTLI